MTELEKYTELVLALDRYTRRRFKGYEKEDVCAALIDLAIWRAVWVLGRKNAVQWASEEVNRAVETAHKFRKRAGLDSAQGKSK